MHIIKMYKEKESVWAGGRYSLFKEFFPSSFSVFLCSRLLNEKQSQVFKLENFRTLS